MIRWLNELAEIARLPAGWDSYSAAPPGRIAIENAEALVKEATKLTILPEAVEPSVMGGVGVTFARGSREVVIEFYNSGTAHALFADDATGNMTTQAVFPNLAGYRKIIGEAQKYLYGE